MGKNAAAAIAGLGAVAIYLAALAAWPRSRGACRRLAGSALAPATGRWPARRSGSTGRPYSACRWPRCVLGTGTSRSGPLFLAGGLCGLMVACRPVDAVFALAAWGWVISHHGRSSRWSFTLGGAVVALFLLAQNLYFFDTPYGGYADIEHMHGWAHGVEGTWTAPFLEGASGTLFSPSHGLFVYSPWLLPSTARAPVVDQNSQAQRNHQAPVSLYGFWPVSYRTSCCYQNTRAGGPDTATAPASGSTPGPCWPSWALWPSSGRRTQAAGSCLPYSPSTFALSIALQAVGFLCYPSTWHGQPTNADRDHARLWDWHDSEVTRGIREGPKPASW